MTKIYNQAELNQQRLSITAGLLATSTVAIIQMIGLESLDWYLETSVTLFAIAIPTLSLEIVLVYHEISTGDKIENILRKFFRAGAQFIVLVAFGGIVLHLHYAAGKYFTVVTVSTMILWMFFNYTATRRRKLSEATPLHPASQSTDLASPEHLP